MYKLNILTIYPFFTCLPSEHTVTGDGDWKQNVDTHDHTKYTAMKVNTAGGYKMSEKGNEFARFVLVVKSEISRIPCHICFINGFF